MTRRRVRRSGRARTEIRRIAQRIAQSSGSANVALKWLADLDAEAEKLGDAAGKGTARDDVAPGWRSTPFGNYLIFFKPGRRTVTVMRVIHGNRDLSEGLPVD
jgi:toxin ParE1/3/4